MTHILRWIDGIAFAGAVTASIACLCLAVMLVFEVIVTSFFEWSQPWAVEYSGYLLLFVLFSGSGWALKQGAHIRVTALTDMLPTSWMRWLDILCSLAALALTAYLSAALVEHAWRSYGFGSLSVFPSRSPLYIPQAALALSVIILSLSLLARIIRRLRGEEVETPSTIAGLTE
jgi:TRAP-type C4-dicarboxylate transport system permease small subunit